MHDGLHPACRQRVRLRPGPPLRAREEGHAGGLTGAELRVGAGSGGLEVLRGGNGRITVRENRQRANQIGNWIHQF